MTSEGVADFWTKPILIFIDHRLNYILLILCRTSWPSSLKPWFIFTVAIDLYIFHKPTNIIATVSFTCFDAFSLALRFTTWFTSSIYLTPPTFSTAQDCECLVSVIFRISPVPQLLLLVYLFTWASLGSFLYKVICTSRVSGASLFCKVRISFSLPSVILCRYYKQF